MKILITGSSGMLGTDLCLALSKAYKIAGMDVKDPAEKIPGMVFYKADISDSRAVKRIVGEFGPDLVIHTAAWTDVDGCEIKPGKAEMINLAGTQNVVEAIAGKNIPLIAISTDFVFSGKNSRPYTETDPTGPVNIYGKMKLEAEKAIRKGLADHLIIRTGWLFGKHGKNFVETMIKKASAGEKLRVVGDQVGGPTYTRDLAGGIKKLIESSDIRGQKVINVSNAGKCSWFEFAGEILKKTGYGSVRIEKISSSDLKDRPARRPAFSVLDNGKFKSVTGFSMRPWDAALEEYLSER